MEIQFTGYAFNKMFRTLETINVIPENFNVTDKCTRCGKSLK